MTLQNNQTGKEKKKATIKVWQLLLICVVVFCLTAPINGVANYVKDIAIRMALHGTYSKQSEYPVSNGITTPDKIAVSEETKKTDKQEISEDISLKAELYVIMGSIKELLKMHKSAISDYTKAIQLEPGYAKVYYYRGYSKTELKQYEDAILDYNMAIQLNPEDAFAYYNRGLAYGDLYRYEEAVKDFDMYIRLKPDDTERYNQIQKLKKQWNMR